MTDQDALLVTGFMLELFNDSASLFGKQHWVTGGNQIEELNLFHKQMENRLGTQRSCSFTHSVTYIATTQYKIFSSIQ